MAHSSVPPEPEIANRFVLPDIEHHATAIGYICITFAAVEFEIDEMIRDALSCSSIVKRAVVTSAGRLENRVTILRHCLLDEGQPVELMTEFGKMTIRLKELIKQRNRVVHDCWINAPAPTQINQTAAIGKSGSFAQQGPLEPRIIKRSLKDLWRLHNELHTLQAQLTVYRTLFSNLRSRATPRQ